MSLRVTPPGQGPLKIDRREFSRRVVAFAATAAMGSCGGSGRKPGEGGVTIMADLMVPMRDGVRLATDVYLPKSGTGPVPVLLERTPYGKTRDSRTERSLQTPDGPLSRAEVAGLFVSRGFAVVYQDCRGRYDSEGEYRKYLDDPADGFDTCAWLMEEDWCEGRIGTLGFSYAAHTQAALASVGAPGLTAMFVDSGGFSNAFQGGIRQGGAFELKQATWAFRNAKVSPEALADPRLRSALDTVDIEAWFRRMPWKPGASPVSMVPAYEEYLFEQWTHGDFDEYWKQPGVWAEGFWDSWPDAPTTFVSSWFDPYPRAAADNFNGLRARKRGPFRLVLGPWTHGDRSQTWAGDVDFGPESVLDGQVAKDIWDLRARWFDRWLKGVRNGVESEPAVRYFRMGGGSGRRGEHGRMEHGGTWLSADNWPPENATLRSFYLSAAGSLDPNPQRGEVGRRDFDYDPSDPVPTVGGAITSGAPIMVGGAFDQREGPEFFGSSEPYRRLADRPDVLVFQTPVLESPLEVSGPVEVELWISSDAPDTDFTAKLIDVYPPNPDYPDGYAMNLTDGILRVRYRDSWEEPELMNPGERYFVRVSLYPVSNLFATGHRLRLDISSSNFPRFDLNLNTGEPEGRATGRRIARNTVFTTSTNPSRLILPVVDSV